MSTQGRLLILTGPSCIGKSPLVKSLYRDYPGEMAGIRPLVLYNDRLPRPGEEDGVDYHFRKREAIEALSEDFAHVVMEVRGDLQALDVEGLKKDLESGSILFEGNPFIAKVLQTDARMAGVPRRSVFVSPVSREEIAALQAIADRIQPAAVVTDIMRRKLLRRLRRQKGEASLPALEDIERRAHSAWTEIQMAPLFDEVVVNHDGEDSENWDAFPIVVGSARKAVLAVHDAFFNPDHVAGDCWSTDVFDGKP